LERSVARDLRVELIAMMPRLRCFGLALTRTFADADDLMQTAIERALSRSVQLRTETKLDAWMYGIMRNLWLDRMRANRVRRHEDLETARDIVGDDGIAIVERNGLLSDVRRALARLPEEQRSVLILVCVDGLSYTETAQTLGLAIGTVASRVARGREALHAQLHPDTRTVETLASAARSLNAIRNGNTPTS
jgi:RNA polymerase sigma-70 factor (ECF subfamily)